MYRLPDPPAPWAPGTFWIPAAGSANASTVQALANEFGLPFTAVTSAPGGRMSQLKPLRVGLYRRYIGGNMDEGWTRFIFDNWEVPYARVEADEIRKGGLNERYDALLFADDDLRSMIGVEAREQPPAQFPAGDLPPEYRKGLGDAGIQALREFVQNGGSLVLLDGATALATERFGLPVKNVLAGLSAKDFFAPGSTVRVQMDPSEPLAYGMPKDALILFFDSVAFDIGNSLSNNKISVVGTIALAICFEAGGSTASRHLAQQAALLDVGYGRGRIVLVGFRTRIAPNRTGPTKCSSTRCTRAEPKTSCRRLPQELDDSADLLLRRREALLERQLEDFFGDRQIEIADRVAHLGVHAGLHAAGVPGDDQRQAVVLVRVGLGVLVHEHDAGVIEQRAVAFRNRLQLRPADRRTPRRASGRCRA